MNSHEIVKRTLEFNHPCRLAVSGVDFAPVQVGPTPRQDRLWKDLIDEWGCGWIWPYKNIKGICNSHPLANLDDMPNYTEWPEYSQDIRFKGWDEQLARARQQGKYVVATIPHHGLFERLQNLHGLENCMIDLIDDEARPKFEALADKVLGIMISLVQETARRFPGGVDAWELGDDWGTQQAGFVSLDMWRDFFLPRYRRLGAAVKNAGCSYWLHSCGKINELIEGFIEAGFDLVNNMQPRTTNPQALADKYKGRITIRSGADIQVTTGIGERQDLNMRIEDADAWMEAFGDSAGGFIYQGEGNPKKDTFAAREYQRYSEWSEKIFGEPLP